MVAFAVRCREEGRSNLAKWLALFQGFLAVGGLVLVLAGLYTKFRIEDHLLLLKGHPGGALPAVLYAAGSLLVAFHAAGVKVAADCASSKTRHRFRNMLLLCLMFHMVVAVFTLAIGISVFAHRAAAHPVLSHGIAEALGRYKRDSFTKTALDELQMGLQCCGSYGYQDWLKVPWVGPKWIDMDSPEVKSHLKEEGLIIDSVPFSCCDPAATRPCVHHHVTSTTHHRGYDPTTQVTLYKQGCTPALAAEFEKHLLIPIGSFTLVLFLAEIVAVILLRYMQTAFETANRWGDPEGPGLAYLFAKNPCAGDDGTDPLLNAPDDLDVETGQTGAPSDGGESKELVLSKDSNMHVVEMEGGGDGGGYLGHPGKTAANQGSFIIPMPDSPRDSDLMLMNYSTLSANNTAAVGGEFPVPPSEHPTDGTHNVPRVSTRTHVADGAPGFESYIQVHRPSSGSSLASISRNREHRPDSHVDGYRTGPGNTQNAPGHYTETSTGYNMAHQEDHYNNSQRLSQDPYHDPYDTSRDNRGVQQRDRHTPTVPGSYIEPAPAIPGSYLEPEQNYQQSSSNHPASAKDCSAMPGQDHQQPSNYPTHAQDNRAALHNQGYQQPTQPPYPAQMAHNQVPQGYQQYPNQAYQGNLPHSQYHRPTDNVAMRLTYNKYSTTKRQRRPGSSSSSVESFSSALLGDPWAQDQDQNHPLDDEEPQKSFAERLREGLEQKEMIEAMEGGGNDHDDGGDDDGGGDDCGGDDGGDMDKPDKGDRDKSEKDKDKKDKKEKDKEKKDKKEKEKQDKKDKKEKEKQDKKDKKERDKQDKKDKKDKKDKDKKDKKDKKDTDKKDKKDKDKDKKDKKDKKDTDKKDKKDKKDKDKKSKDKDSKDKSRDKDKKSKDKQEKSKGKKDKDKTQKDKDKKSKDKDKKRDKSKDKADKKGKDQSKDRSKKDSKGKSKDKKGKSDKRDSSKGKKKDTKSQSGKDKKSKSSSKKKDKQGQAKKKGGDKSKSKSTGKTSKQKKTKASGTSKKSKGKAKATSKKAGVKPKPKAKKAKPKVKKAKPKVKKAKPKMKKPKPKMKRPKPKMKRPKPKMKRPKAKMRRPKAKMRRPKARKKMGGGGRRGGGRRRRR